MDVKQWNWVPITLATILSCAVIFWILGSDANKPIQDEVVVATQPSPDEIAAAIPSPAAIQDSNSAVVDNLADEAVLRKESTPSPKPPAQEGTVSFKVVDAAGTPVVGIQVAVGMRVPFDNRAVRLGTGTSVGADGIARVELDKRTLEKHAGLLQNPELMADAKFPSHSSTRIKFLLKDGLNSPQEIIMPTFQWLNAEVRLPEGGFPDFPVRVQVFWSKGEPEPGKGKWSNRRSIHLDLIDGAVRFPCEVDLDLSFNARAKDGHRRRGHLRTTGPELGDPPPPPYEVILGEVFPRLQAVILLPNGEPARDARFAHYLLKVPLLQPEDSERGRRQSNKRPSWRSTFVADHEGRIDLPIEFEPAVVKDQSFWAFVMQNPNNRGPSLRLDEEGAVQVRVALPSPTIAGSIYEPGPLQLHTVKLPFLAGGRVVDAQKNGIKVSISVYSADENFKYDHLGSSESDHDGNFEVLGKAPGNGQIRVTATGTGWMYETQVVASGTNNLLFRLAKSISIKGRFLLDGDIPWLEMEVKIPKAGRNKNIFPGGGYTIDYLKPGSYSVVLEHNDQVLYRSPEVTVAGSGDVAPPALNPIDLRGKFRVWSLIPLDAKGKPFAAKTRFLIRLSEEDASMAAINRAGQLVQITSSDITHIEVMAKEGYEPLRVNWPVQNQRVQLRVDQR